MKSALRYQLWILGFAVIALGLLWIVYDRSVESVSHGRWGVWVDPNAPPAPQPGTGNEAPATGNRELETGNKEQETLPATAGDDPDFPRKGPPKPGEWLARFPEKGQTVDAYKRACARRKDKDRGTLVIQPLGGILDKNADTIARVRAYVGLFYDCAVDVAEPVAMPPDAFVARRRQYDVDPIVRMLRDRVPDKALACIGFCEEDLFTERLNFVFGVGVPSMRAGVYSLARYGEKDAVENDEPIFLKRTLKVASHELGHMLGMDHCVRFECNMNGSNSVDEMDREPMHLCPECLAKARWCTGLDAKARYEKLAAWYEKAGLKADAAFARRQGAKMNRKDAKGKSE